MQLTYRWRATLVIGLGLLMSLLDVTIVSVVLPQIATALHAAYQTSTWIGTGYLLANGEQAWFVGAREVELRSVLAEGNYIQKGPSCAIKTPK